MMDTQNCCTQGCGTPPCRLVFVMDSCRELPVLLPQWDQDEGSFPAQTAFVVITGNYDDLAVSAML